MTQTELNFDITRNRHRGNPESEAAHDSIVLYKSESQLRVLEVLRRKGATSKELSRSLSMGYTTVSARLSELKKLGEIEPTGEKRERAAVLRAKR